MNYNVNLYIRYENFKHIVLNELLSKHDHAELDAKLNEAAWRSTLWIIKQVFRLPNCFIRTLMYYNILIITKLHRPPPYDSLQRCKHNHRAALQTCMKRGLRHFKGN